MSGIQPPEPKPQEAKEWVFEQAKRFGDFKAMAQVLTAVAIERLAKAVEKLASKEEVDE